MCIRDSTVEEQRQHMRGCTRIRIAQRTGSRPFEETEGPAPNRAMPMWRGDLQSLTQTALLLYAYSGSDARAA
eukprot:11674613-Alexandrium_andersonii.AAC.1